MWDGWPRRWYLVVAVGELSIEKVELRTLFCNIVVLSCLLVASVAATEFLIRELGRIYYLNTSLFLASIAAICTFAALQSNHAPTEFHDFVFMVQELALLTIYAFLFVCWFAAFRFVGGFVKRELTS